MAFDGNEGSVVSLDDASRWTANYRNTIQEGDTLAQFVGKEKLLEVLNQEGCMGIRFYYGISDEGEKNLIGVGAASDEDDMVDGVIIEKFFFCPPYCPRKKNKLNS